MKLLNVDLKTRTSEYELVFGYEVCLDDKSVYELISKYSKESKENSSSNSDKEYSLRFDKESLTLH